MSSAFRAMVTPLVGSLGVHGALAFALLFSVRSAARVPEPSRVRPDSWAGNAVEVDAVATPEAASNAESGGEERVLERAATDVAVAAPNQDSTPPVKRAPEVAPRIAPPPRVTARLPKATRPAASDEASGNGTSGAGVAKTAAGAFGGEALPPGVRSLPSAFTRAIPPATGADPIWQTLPPGSQHPFTIALEVDGDGHVNSAEILRERDGSPPDVQATHLRERVLALLRGGLFALQNEVGAGRALFRVAITLSDRATHADADPAELVERGFEPPHGNAAGRAYFTLASGRHFEAKVQVLARP